MSTYTTDPKQVTIDMLRARIAVLEAFVKAWDRWRNDDRTFAETVHEAREAVGEVK